MDQEFALNLPYEELTDQQPPSPLLANMDVVIGYDNMNDGKDVSCSYTDLECMLMTIHIIAALPPPPVQVLSPPPSQEGDAQPVP